VAIQADQWELIGDFFALRWQDGKESVIALEALRRACPCARCAGEPDITGATRILAQPEQYSSASFELRSWESVGLYALALTWGDGHDTGIFGWDLLRGLGE